jgi:quercetin dioxygenase-like cupin family protein
MFSAFLPDIRRAARAPAYASLALGLLLAGAGPIAASEDDTTILNTGKTILGQPFAYPTGAPAKVTVSVITLKPGDERGWHKHEVPLLGYVLDGELTIDFGKLGTKVFRKGDAFVEAIDTAHNGRNLGKEDVRLLAVFMGADGSDNAVRLSGPPPQ